MTRKNRRLLRFITSSFAVAPERHDAVAQMFTGLGFTLAPAELTELGLRINLDWDHGIELISPLPGSTADGGRIGCGVPR